MGFCLNRSHLNEHTTLMIKALAVNSNCKNVYQQFTYVWLVQFLLLVMVTMKYYCITTCLHSAIRNWFPYSNWEYEFIIWRLQAIEKHQDIKSCTKKKNQPALSIKLTQRQVTLVVSIWSSFAQARTWNCFQFYFFYVDMILFSMYLRL